jgi:hypothetical protein
VAGDRPGDDEAEVLGGTPSESTASLATAGDAKSAKTGDLKGAAATWKPHGEFKWWIEWSTDGTSGWIVQKITNGYSGTDKSGTAITDASVGVTPSYYEAWEVDGAGKITGSLGGTGNRDRWERPSLGAGSKGDWSMKGEVCWAAEDPAKSGFKSGGIGNAGTLLSDAKAPAKLSKLLLTRNANGKWDSTGKTPTHTGSAK